MNKTRWLKRISCVALVVFLLLIFCAAGHECHHDSCSVCLLAASFRLTLGSAALALVSPGLTCVRLLAGVPSAAVGRGNSLVALKVKLSD